MDLSEVGHRRYPDAIKVLQLTCEHRKSGHRLCESINALTGGLNLLERAIAIRALIGRFPVTTALTTL